MNIQHLRVETERVGRKSVRVEKSWSQEPEENLGVGEIL